MGTENCDDPSMIPAQQRLCKDDATFNQTVAGGAIIGGLVGAGTGAVACMVAAKHTNPLVCAAIGLGAGLFVGGVAGYVVAKKQQAARDNIREIDAVTGDIRQQNQNLRGEISTAYQVARHDQQRLAQINAEQRAGSMSADQARAERDRIARDSSRLDDLIKRRQDQVNNFRSAGQQVNQSSGDYSRQLAEMQRNVAALRQQKDALDRAMQETG